MVENLQDGRIRLARAGRTLRLDLARDISGCPRGTYDVTTNEQFEPSVAVEIVDETEKAPYVYVVLLASAPPNCNIQGICGAGGSDSTLLWLKLGRDLSLAGKQAFAIDACQAGRSAKVSVEEDPEKPDLGTIRAKDLPWVGDRLQIEYQEENEESLHRLVYDRKAPEAGLQRAH